MNLKSCTIVFSLLLISSCGFHLRGSITLPSDLESLHLESSVGESDLLQALRRALTAADVNLLDIPGSGVYSLGIGQEEVEERVLSVNSNARAGEYQLSISVPVQVRSGQIVVVGPEILTIEKVYLADPDNAVAKQEEREIMEDEIRQELVLQILRRLQTFTP
jgi:LPS-assembly lipoprotein